MGRETTVPSRRRTIGSGDAPDHGDLGEAQEVQVRARVHQPEDPVDVEGVGARDRQVEALGEHHLEDVAGRDVLLGRLDAVLVQAGRHGAARRRLGECRLARAADGQRRSRGRKQSAASVSSCAHGRLVGRVHLIGAPGRVDDHVVDEDDPLAPVVEGGQLADDRQRRRRAGRGRPRGRAGRCSTSRTTS